MRKVLAVIESEEMRVALERTLSREYALTLCADAREGGRGLQQTPDALILDLYLPGTTGLRFLEERREQLPPVVLVLSPLATTYVLQTVARLGAGFLIRTPCTMEEVAVRLADMLRPPEPTETIRLHLHALRLDPGLIGYQYLCRGLDLFARDPSQPLTKTLYPAVAAPFGVTAQAVEHGIRDAIRDAWQRRDDAVWQRYFPGCGKCPTNRTFLATLAEFG